MAKAAKIIEEEVKELETTVSIKDLEEAALDRVLKAMKISRAELDDAEEKVKNPPAMYEYNLGPGVEIRVNGRPVPRSGTATMDEIDLYASLLGNYRMRMIREKIREEKEIIQLAGGGITSRLVRTEE